MHASLCAGLALSVAAVAAADLPPLLLPRQTPAPTPASSSSSSSGPRPSVTAITSCQLRASQLVCLAASTTYKVQTTPTQTTDVPAQFTGCHRHGSDMYCVGPNGKDVEVTVDDHDHAHAHDHDHDHDHAGHAAAAGHKHCHFHAGIEHCVGGDADEIGPSTPQCGAIKRDYNVGLRIGLLFAILASSALGVFGPILLHKLLPRKLNIAFTVLKQFGTGIIISTALVHLYTHASLMFANKCVGELGYEATTSAILMAGLFLSFVVEYVGHRIVVAKTRSTSAITPHDRARALLSTEVVSILVMEVGILFHSLLIGLTLVVAGDAFFITLFVVILFHQVFEGLALGTRIATIGTDDASPGAVRHDAALPDAHHAIDKSTNSPAEDVADVSTAVAPRRRPGLPMRKKLGLAALFAFITPIGMAIGIGVLQNFNGNDRSTLITIGTLDALSAGILVWVGVVEMWAADWLVGSHGREPDLADANMLTVILAGFGLVAGMTLMSLLGKWA